MSIFDHLIITVGTVLLALAITITSIGYTWHLIKPTIEKIEVQYFDANISFLYHLQH